MPGIPEEILDLIFAGESETLEFKTALSDPATLARLIASFANTSGGTILVGVSEPPAVIGIDPDRFERVYKAALQRLEPEGVRTSLRFLDGGGGLKVAAVDVEKSPQLVLTQGSAFVRTGSVTRPMQWTQMLQQVSTTQPHVTLQTLAQAIEKQTAHLEKLSADNDDLKDELRKANDPAAKRKERGYGFLFGIAASLIAALCWVGATKAFPILK
ncbi:RNA-binding domain-containing protein [Duganella hordei]|uniref:RNA-binding domain-containing protein n=1 Tax=Duganella hordei TaxID=2865934 RepID=UPI0030E7F296